MNQKNNSDFPDEKPLDDYERDLKKFLDRGEFVSDPNFKENKKMFEEMAKKHVALQGSKRITIRVKNRDLAQLKAKAENNNIPYQTLIGLLIRNYNQGRVKLSL